MKLNSLVQISLIAVPLLSWSSPVASAEIADTIVSATDKGEERNVMLNASDATKPREIQIGLPSEDVNVYENGLPAVYSSTVHQLARHWRSDASLSNVGLINPMAIDR